MGEACLPCLHTATGAELGRRRRTPQQHGVTPNSSQRCLLGATPTPPSVSRPAEGVWREAPGPHGFFLDPGPQVEGGCPLSTGPEQRGCPSLTSEAGGPLLPPPLLQGPAPPGSRPQAESDAGRPQLCSGRSRDPASGLVRGFWAVGSQEGTCGCLAARLTVHGVAESLGLWVTRGWPSRLAWLPGRRVPIVPV